MPVILNIANTLGQAFSNLIYLWRHDYNSFKEFFPHIWWLLYFVVRIVPLLAIVFWVTKLFDRNFAAAISYRIKQFTDRELKPHGQPLQLTKDEGKTLALLTLLTFILRLIFLLLTDNRINGDACSRLNMAFEWMHHPTAMTGYDWLPLHFYMLGTIMKLTGDVLYAPRMLGLTLGTLTVIPFYFIVRRVFSQRHALYTAFAFALLGSHIQLSAVTLSEVPALFFFLLALYYLLKFIERPVYLYLLPCTFFLACMSLLRFEGWMFAGVFFLVILYKKIEPKKIIAYCLLVAIAPLFIMYQTWLGTGNPLYGITYSDYEVQNLFTLTHHRIIDSVFNLHFAFIFLSVVFVPIGIYRSIGIKERTPYLIVFVLPFAYTFYKVLSGSLIGDQRYFLISSTLSIPFFISAFIEAETGSLKKLSSPVRFIILLTALITVKNLFLLTDPIRIDMSGVFPPGFFQSAYWVRDNLKGQRLYLDNYDYTNAAWQVYANQLTINNQSKEHEGVVDGVSGRFWLGEHFSEDEFEKAIATKHVSHLVLFKDGEIANQLKFSKAIEQWHGYRFTEQCNFNGFRVYSISKADTPQAL